MATMSGSSSTPGFMPWPKRRKGEHDDSTGVAEVQYLGERQIGMPLDLDHRGFDSRLIVHLPQLFEAHVRQADRSAQPAVYEFLRGPSRCPSEWCLRRK